MKSFLPIFAAVTVLSAGVVVAKDQKKSSPAATSEARSAEIKDVTPAQAGKLLKERKDVVVLDVRTPEEFKEGHIRGAKNVDATADSFAKELKGLDRNRTYLLHCASGGRSSRVLGEMKELDFKSIYHLPEGFSGWEDAGNPVEK